MLKSPSQMLGLAPGAAGRPVGGRGGRGRSFLRGSAGGTERGGGAVGRALVGGGVLSGGPSGKRRTTLATRAGAGHSGSSVGHGPPGQVWPSEPQPCLAETALPVLGLGQGLGSRVNF